MMVVDGSIYTLTELSLANDMELLAAIDCLQIMALFSIPD